MNLANLTPGHSAVVTGLGGPLYGRLRDLGLIEGTRVECLMKSPLGDPSAYLIRGAVIALRRSDAGEVEIDPISDAVQAPVGPEKAVRHGAF